MEGKLGSILSLVGAISGVCALLAVALVWGVRLGKIETSLVNLEKQMVDPQEYGELKGKVMSLYDMFNDLLAASGNPSPGDDPGAIEWGSILPEDVRSVADEVTADNPDKSAMELTSLVLQEIGGEEGQLVSILRESSLNIEEFVRSLRGYIVQIQHDPGQTQLPTKAEE